jgi:inward rectifier potassium channel
MRKQNTTARPTLNGNAPEDLRDLGFGSRVSDSSRERLLNRDGSFNVERDGLPFFRSLNTYHTLLTMSTGRFALALVAGYVAVNTIFALLFFLCGPNALSGAEGLTAPERLANAFFFSVQTFTSVGYGAIHPTNFPANLLATADAFIGLLSVALATGLLFARFSRPTARLLYSNHAVIAPHRDGAAFMFRIVNLRKSQLIEVDVVAMFTRLVEREGTMRREYHALPLERKHVAFFPLHWTLVHPIDATSPLHAMEEADFHACQAEVLILITAVDDTFAQTVHSRSSYRHDEVIWRAKFVDPFEQRNDGSMRVDLDRMHLWERVG